MNLNNNSAWKGKNIFVRCFSLSAQISSSQFSVSPEESDSSLYSGTSTTIAGEVDVALLPLITAYHSNVIMVGGAGADEERSCGTSSHPCSTLTSAAGRLEKDGEDSSGKRLYISEGARIGGETELTDTILISLDCSMQQEILVSESVTDMKDGCLGLVTLQGECLISLIHFSITRDFHIPYGSYVSILQGSSVTISETTFTSSSTATPAILTHALIATSSSAFLSLIQVRITNFNTSTALLSVFLDAQDSGLTNNAEVYDGRLSFNLVSISSIQTTHKVGSFFTLPINSQLFGCVFDGYTATSISDSSLCEWKGSLIHITRSFASIVHCSFVNGSEGALQMTSTADVSINSTSFMQNRPSATTHTAFEGYPSLQHNILCSDRSVLTFNSFMQEDAVSSRANLWIQKGDCTLKGLLQQFGSVLFIPSLSTVEVSEVDAAGELLLTLTGSSLFPCNLFFILNCDEMISPLLEITTFVNETRLNVRVESDLSRTITNSSVVSLSLAYGSPVLQQTIPVPLINRTPVSSVRGETVVTTTLPSYLIITAFSLAGIFFLLFLALLLVVIRCKTKSTSKEQLYSADNAYLSGRVEEMECTSAVDQSTSSSTNLLMTPDAESASMLPSRTEDSQRISSTPTIAMAGISTITMNTQTPIIETPPVNHIQVIQCFGSFQVKKLKHICTLQEWLHAIDSSHNDPATMKQNTVSLDYQNLPTVAVNTVMESAGNISASVEIIMAVSHCFRHILKREPKQLASLLSTLSPTTIVFPSPPPLPTLLSSGHHVFLALSTHNGEESSIRYLAPEIEHPAEQFISSLNSDQQEKAVAFSLGMILVECLTGEAPFPSLSEQQARAKIRSGYVPSVDSVENRNFRHFVKKMVSITPKVRPSLQQIITTLSLYRMETTDDDDEEQDDEEDTDDEEEYEDEESEEDDEEQEDEDEQEEVSDSSGR